MHARTHVGIHARMQCDGKFLEKAGEGSQSGSTHFDIYPQETQADL